jgi:hypothetical protein
MAGDATDPAIDVRRVIEIDVVRQTVNAHPRNRFPCPPTIVDRLQFGARRVKRAAPKDSSDCGS